MDRRLAGPLAVWAMAGFLFCCGQACRAADAPATQPAADVKTGAVDLTFTERSPLSAPKELARRLNLKPGDMGADYDLSKRPFKAYVPKNYDPGTPVGVFVYLGYKDSVSTPPLWNPVLDAAHLIFITPVCHSGAQYPPAVPLWQTTGLALDAVYNLKKQYAIDDKRVYLMSWTKGSTQTSLATADVFKGFIVTYDQSWFEPIRAKKGGTYPSNFSPPPGVLLHDAEDHPFFLIDDKSVELAKEIAGKASAMRQFGFEHVMQAGLSSGDDLHYPNLKAEWFSQQALPFLDQFAGVGKESAAAAANSDAAPATTAPAGPSEAQSLLTEAQLLITNGQTELARNKLKRIIEVFPGDPVTPKAKQLLDQINNQ